MWTPASPRARGRPPALELAIASVEKEYGKGAIMRLKEGQSLHEDIATVPTGSLGLDIALGIGGYPRGRIVEIYGPESSGKTTLTLHAIAANVQRRAAPRPSSTPSTRSTSPTPRSSA
jgi:RecA/RadA recombinase